MAVSSLSSGASMSVFSSQVLFDEKIIDQVCLFHIFSTSHIHMMILFHIYES